MREPSAAQALYGHLPSAARPEVDHRRKPNTADAIFPAWSREAKARERDQRLWGEILERQRQSFRQGMREARERRERG
jgi:hypothetical protein